MAGKVFSIIKKIRIQHCDPAGVVFTPQYFNLFIEVIEDWFSEGLNYSFSELITKDASGIPAMSIEAKFHNPSLLGDNLHFSIIVEKVRKTTVSLKITARSAELEKRCIMKFLYGFSNLNSKGLSPWPNQIRLKMEEYLP
ncbi:acyl-CoA thioesterase [Leptospira terpstrae]|uniref:acyl-CoA thioesterase n=1 Tax=Leptospira TaxID=171 RepID=UPI001963F230|nr:acyl-CoA thioesterase [Leptospira chreensis]MBM9591439.1 acyl-CoA thioesterase [Leptospira chreensis]